MTTRTEQLPISSTLTPADPTEVAAAVREAHESNTALYPLGGGTSLDYGLPARKPGKGLSLERLQRVLDYPARDLTITVEAGVTMRTLAETLAKERQRLPIDVPQSDLATIGGVVATNCNGPRRYGQGTVRDYVIGIQAVDGRGTEFKGGGRVVKNVAGYDFCKLLTGSLGTLAVITQVTLKLRPLAERLAIMVCPVRDEEDCERLLAAVGRSATTPVAVELLAGPEWEADAALAQLKPGGPAWGYLAVGLEGTAAEVRWMTDQLGREWWNLGVGDVATWLDVDAEAFWRRLVELPAAAGATIVTQASIRPSGVAALVSVCRRLDPRCSLVAHAGNGIVITRFSQPPLGGVTKGLIGQLQSAAVASQGHVCVLRSAAGIESTHQSVWGPLSAPQELMTSVKRQFDPRNILNPDRFVYAGGWETDR